MPELHAKQFPNESAEYRAARNEVLLAEIALRQQTESVAQMRRELPPGGALKEDYLFDELVDGTIKRTKFSELFQPGKNTLVVYSMMYHPDDEKACSSCTSILDGVDGSAPHIMDRVSLAVVSKTPMNKLRAWADYRGWNNLRLLSSFSNTYNHDYYGENENGGQSPALNVFTRTPEGIVHNYCTELLFAPSEPGQCQFLG